MYEVLKMSSSRHVLTASTPANASNPPSLLRSQRVKHLRPVLVIRADARYSRLCLPTQPTRRSCFNVWLPESKSQISESIVRKSKRRISRHGTCETLPSRAARRTIVAIGGSKAVRWNCSNTISSKPCKFGRACTSACAASASKVLRNSDNLLRVWQPGRASRKGGSSGDAVSTSWSIVSRCKVNSVTRPKERR